MNCYSNSQTYSEISKQENTLCMQQNYLLVFFYIESYFNVSKMLLDREVTVDWATKFEPRRLT